MASRFTSASSTTPGSESTSKDKNKKEEIVTIVRTVVDWQPSRLLCKRFNIANPHKDKSLEEIESGSKPDQVDDILDERTIQRLLQERDRDLGHKKVDAILEKGEERKRQEEGGENNSEKKTIKEESTNPYAEDEPTSLKEDKSQVQERPSMDLFNSIFNDSDDDDDDDDDSEEEKNENKSKLPANTEIIVSIG